MPAIFIMVRPGGACCNDISDAYLHILAHLISNNLFLDCDLELTDSLSLLHDHFVLLAFRGIGREQRTVAERIFEGEHLDRLEIRSRDGWRGVPV